MVVRMTDASSNRVQCTMCHGEGLIRIVPPDGRKSVCNWCDGHGYVDATRNRAAEDVVSNVIRTYEGKGLSAGVFASYIVAELRGRGFRV